MIFGRAKGEENMSKKTIDEVQAEEVVEEVPSPVESPKKPTREEPESSVVVTASGAIIEVPLDCDDKPETDVLLNQMAIAKVLAVSKVSKVIKAVRNSKTRAVESRPILDMAAKKLVIDVTFEPAVNEDFVKSAQEAV